LLHLHLELQVNLSLSLGIEGGISAAARELGEVRGR
jgi:hypothetical protein